MQQYEKLSDYAKRVGLKYQSVWKQYKQGRLPQVEKINGSLFVPIESEKDSSQYNRAITYARVSSAQNKDNCETQSQRLYDFCTAHGWTVVRQVTEIGSGMNEDRKRLWSILHSDNWDILVVEHKDRLTRFGFSFIEALIEEKGKELIVINQSQEKNTEEELINDLVSIITSFCARIYGHRRSQRKTERIINQLKEENKEL